MLSSSAFPALGAPGVGLVGVAPEAAVSHHVDLGQEGGQGPGSSRFGGAAFPADEHAADARIHGVQDQGAAHALLADDGGKWINGRHRDTYYNL